MAGYHKVMDIDFHDGGKHLVVYYTTNRKVRNPYKVYNLYHRDGLPGYYRRRIAEYGDWISVLCFLKDLYMAGADAMITPEFYQWAEDYKKA